MAELARRKVIKGRKAGRPAGGASLMTDGVREIERPLSARKRGPISRQRIGPRFLGLVASLAPFPRDDGGITSESTTGGFAEASTRGITKVAKLDCDREAVSRGGRRGLGQAERLPVDEASIVLAAENLDQRAESRASGREGVARFGPVGELASGAVSESGHG
jgi:hypothetical protein